MWILLFLVDFVKGGVNRPGTGSFNTRQQRDTKARQGYRTSPTTIPPVQPGNRAAAPTSLINGDNKSVDNMVERISEAYMRISIKSLFFQM